MILFYVYMDHLFQLLRNLNLSHDITITYKSYFWRENVKILASFTQRHNGRHYVMLLICKPLLVYRFYCMALYHSQRRRHVIKKHLPQTTLLIIRFTYIQLGRVDVGKAMNYACTKLKSLSIHKPITTHGSNIIFTKHFL